MDHGGKGAYKCALGQSQGCVCGGQRCGLGLPGSAGSFGSAAGDGRSVFQKLNPGCSAGVLQRQEAQKEGSECARWCSKRGGKYSGWRPEEAEFRTETSELTSEFGTLTLVNAVM